MNRVTLKALLACTALSVSSLIGCAGPNSSVSNGSQPDTAENGVPAEGGQSQGVDVPAEEPGPVEKPERTPEEKVTQIWATQSEELPFQVVVVYPSKNAAGDTVYCATVDGQAHAAWPLEVDLQDLSFKLWLRPGGSAGGPSSDFSGASCPAAFASTNLSDGVLPTTAPSVVEFQVNEEGSSLVASGARQPVEFTSVEGVDLNLYMAIAGGEKHLHSETVGFLQGAKSTEGLTVTTSQGDILTVRGKAAAIIKVLAVSPGARFESDREMAPPEPEIE